MSKYLLFISIITFCSCNQQNKQTISNIDSSHSIEKPADSTTNSSVGNKRTEFDIDANQIHQDSLRNEIMKRKDNAILKNSFLQEMYIRDFVKVSQDVLFVDIPFNVHGPDCGAPDCYSTNISFNFKLNDSLIFPKNIQFQEHEHGCIDKETKHSGNFELVEETNSFVIYHSLKHKRTLILFSSNNYCGTTAFYFTGIEKNSVNKQNLDSIVQNYNDGIEDKLYPYISWELSTNEYEMFLQ